MCESKPSAHPLHLLCKQAKVTPQECIVVDDTTSDTGMGRNGNAGLVVGVLSGSGRKKQLLESGAHIILPNIGMLRDIIRTRLSNENEVEISINDLAPVPAELIDNINSNNLSYFIMKYFPNVSRLNSK